MYDPRSNRRRCESASWRHWAFTKSGCATGEGVGAGSVFVKPAPPVAKKKAAKAFTPRLQVTLRVGNEFEGKTFELIHEADTLSKLLAEQDAVKAARKKYRYVEVLSVKSM